jgi:hypothetical protein
MAYAYSHTFMRVNTGYAWVYWTCPAGYRAIVRSVTAAGPGSTLDYQVTIDGFLILFWTSQAPTLDHTVDMRHVCYQGQRIGATGSKGGGHMTVSGYLLADDTGASAPPGQLVTVERDRVEPLPS